MNHDLVNPNRQHRIFACVLMLFALLLALYFRTYVLRVDSAVNSPEKIGKIAEITVKQEIRAQLKNQTKANHPGMSVTAIEQWVDQGMEKVMLEDRGNYEETVRRIVSKIQDEIDVKREAARFLLESDPYYYYDLTQRIQQTGHLSTKIKAGKFFNSKRFAPAGTWDPLTLHPYLGFCWYRFLNWFGKIELMKALCYFPLVLVVLITLTFFFLGSLLKAHPVSIFLGCLALILSPIAIQRSSYGWYDTDPYIYWFPLLILSCYFLGMHKKKPLVYAIAAGLITGIYSFFWIGWQSVWYFMMAAGFLCGILNHLTKLEKSSYHFRFTFFYLICGLLLFLLLPTKATEQIQALRQIGGHEIELATFQWPNTFFTVGELLPPLPRQLIFVIGNYASWAMAIAGAILTGIFSWKRKEKLRFTTWFIFLALALPAFYLSLKAIRFANLLIVPFSLLVVLGAEEIKNFLQRWTARLNMKISPLVPQTIAGLLITFIFLVPAAVHAHVAERLLDPIMNETWRQSLEKIKEETPQESIVNAWWPPGYFINAIANRRTVFDGGGLQSPASHLWMSRALLAEDELMAAGIIQMLNSSGDEALGYLLSNGFKMSDTVNLLTRLVTLPKEKAMDQLQNQMTAEQKKHLLSLIYRDQPAEPAYLFIHDDLIDKNLEMQIMAYWDFDKAQEISNHYKLLNKHPDAQDSLRDEISIIGGPKKYQPESKIVRQTGNLISFSNGLSVDLDTMDCHLSVADQGLEGKPGSLFYMEGSHLVEKEFSEEPKLDASALLIKKRDGYTSVLAHRELIQSLLFRLYYLDGEGLRLFKPFTINKDKRTGTSILVFEINWKAFESERRLAKS